MPVTIRGEQYLSVREAAQMAGVSPATIYRWIAQGKIEAHKTSSERWLIRLLSLEAYLRGEPQPPRRSEAELQSD